MNLLFFGTRLIGIEALKALVAQGHHICCVTTEDYSMDHISSEDFAGICAEHDIPFYQNDKIENDKWRKVYTACNADLGVCVGWRKLIREKIIGTATHGFIGPHGADLPRYRGFAATHYAILNGDPYCGFCIMKYKPGVADNGEICSRFNIPIDESMTIKDLLDKSRPLVIKHIIETIERIENGTLVTEPQDESRSVLSFPRIPEDGELDWHRPAVEIDRLIRAVAKPYPGAFTFFDNRKLFVWRAHILRHPPQCMGIPGHIIHIDGKIGVLTADGIIILDECQFENSATFDPVSYFKTHRLRLGMNHSKLLYELKQRIEKIEQNLQDIENNASKHCRLSFHRFHNR